MTTPTKRDRSVDSSSDKMPDNKRPNMATSPEKWIMRNLHGS